MMFPYIDMVFAFVFGAAIGSFLNVCIYRLPKDLSIVRPPSACPSCSASIAWFDNIPIISWLVLGGKCRACKAPISARYCIVELLTAIVFFILYAKFGLTLVFFKFVIFFCLLIVVSCIDIDYHAIPVYLCFLGIVVGMGFACVESFLQLRGGFFDISQLAAIRAGKALIFGFGFSYLFKFFGDVLLSFYLAWRKKENIEGETEALGLGDVDFMGMVGVFMGISASVVTFFAAPIIALGYAVIAVVFKKSHLIPYLPYLSAGAVVAFFWGNAIIKLFLY